MNTPTIIRKKMRDTNSWNVIFIIMSIIASIFTINGLHDSNYLDKDLSAKISLILIPIISGGVVTKFTTESWHVTKEKISIKQGILSDYQNSYKLLSNLADNFVYKIVERYIVYKTGPLATRDELLPPSNYATGEKQEDKIKYRLKKIKEISPPAESDEVLFESYTKPELSIYAYLTIQDDKFIPSKIFNDDHKELVQKLNAASIVQNKFLSKIRLYFQDDLSKEILEIQKIITDKLDLLNRLMASKNPDDIKKYFTFYEDLISNNKEAIKELEIRMVSLKFRNFNL